MMETYTIIVKEVTFMIEAEDKESALSEVEGILWDHAHDYYQPEVM
jgi:hypothetical protein